MKPIPHVYPINSDVQYFVTKCSCAMPEYCFKVISINLHSTINDQLLLVIDA